MNGRKYTINMLKRGDKTFSAKDAPKILVGYRFQTSRTEHFQTAGTFFALTKGGTPLGFDTFKNSISVPFMKVVSRTEHIKSVGKDLDIPILDDFKEVPMSFLGMPDGDYYVYFPNSNYQRPITIKNGKDIRETVNTDIIKDRHIFENFYLNLPFDDPEKIKLLIRRDKDNKFYSSEVDRFIDKSIYDFSPVTSQLFYLVGNTKQSVYPINVSEWSDGYYSIYKILDNGYTGEVFTLFVKNKLCVDTLLEITSESITNNRCRITGHIVDLQANPVKNIEVIIKIGSFPPGLIIDRTPTKVLTDVDGRFETFVPQNSTISILSIKIGYERIVQIPNISELEVI